MRHYLSTASKSSHCRPVALDHWPLRASHIASAQDRPRASLDLCHFTALHCHLSKSPLSSSTLFPESRHCLCLQVPACNVPPAKHTSGRILVHSREHSYTRLLIRLHTGKLQDADARTDYHGGQQVWQGCQYGELNSPIHAPLHKLTNIRANILSMSSKRPKAHMENARPN